MSDISQLHEDFKLHQEEDKNHFAEMRAFLVRNETSNNEILDRLKPLTDVYDGAIFTKKLVVGAGSLLIGIAAVGAAVLYLFSYFEHRS